MPAVTTLTELLEASGFRPYLFDMGRRVVALSRDSFLAFENSDLPYPLPLRRQAWFGLMFQAEADKTADPVVWFLHFPLDEQAKLVLAARDDFMRRLLENGSAEADEAVAGRARIQTALADNPHAFQPKPERMAMFHAQVTLALQQPASRYYAHARDYFSGRLGWEQWGFLGYQGIADLAARLTQDDNHLHLAEAIPWLPAAPLEALCHCLENVVIPTTLAQALHARCRETLAESAPDPQILSACLRGIAGSPPAPGRELVTAVLSHDIAKRADLLVAISGRVWEVLLDIRLRERFLERLAENDQGEAFFNNILSDLLFLPTLRDSLRAGLADAAFSPRLKTALERFFAAVKAP